MWSRIRRQQQLRGGNAGDGDGSGEGWSSGSDCTNGDVYGRANQRSVLVKLLGLMTTQNNGVTPTFS